MNIPTSSQTTEHVIIRPTGVSSPSKPKMVSVVIPAMNEEDTIGPIVTQVHDALKDGPYAYEVIVVDDHSSDRTAELAKAAGAKVTANFGTRGKGSTLRVGFDEARGDCIVMMDADGSHRAEDMLLLLEPFAEAGTGLVVGSRIYGGSDEYTRVRALGNIFLTAAFGFLHQRYLSDALNGFKVFRREIVDRHPLSAATFAIEIELLVATLRCGYGIKEVPSHERERQGGKAKSSVVRHGTAFLARIVYEWYRTKFNKAPLRPRP